MSVYLGIILFIIIVSLSLFNQDSEYVLVSNQIRVRGFGFKIFLIGFVLFFFAGFRYFVGADYAQYASNFAAYCTQKLSWNHEPGIRIVAKMCSVIYKHYFVMFVGMSIITVGLCVRTIEKNSRFFLISILLYIFLGCWHESFNSVMQSAAVAILFWGHQFIKERKLTKWILICIIAFFFHKSAIVFFLLYFIPRNNISFWKVAFLALIGVAVALVYDRVWGIISVIEHDFVIDQYALNQINIFRIAVAWAPILFFFLFLKRTRYFDDCEDKETLNLYAMTSVLNAAILLGARNSTYLGRAALFTDIYNTLFWAHMFSLFPKEKKNTTAWIIVVLLCYFVFYLNEASGEFLNHYRWIFGNI